MGQGLVGKEMKDQWLNLTLNSTQNNTPQAVICVDGKSAGSYYYQVIVPGVGEIDPRVDVGL